MNTEGVMRVYAIDQMANQLANMMITQKMDTSASDNKSEAKSQTKKGKGKCCVIEKTLLKKVLTSSYTCPNQVIKEKQTYIMTGMKKTHVNLFLTKDGSSKVTENNIRVDIQVVDKVRRRREHMFFQSHQKMFF